MREYNIGEAPVDGAFVRKLLQDSGCTVVNEKGCTAPTPRLDGNASGDKWMMFLYACEAKAGRIDVSIRIYGPESKHTADFDKNYDTGDWSLNLYATK